MKDCNPNTCCGQSNKTTTNGLRARGASLNQAEPENKVETVKENTKT